MKKNKAPGPDGFNVEFFLHYWHIVGDCFCEAVKSFFSTSSMHKGVNSTVIALIPKTVSSCKMQDYRPISLCKILASHLKLVLPNVIDHAQSTFVHDRQISDNILLAQELFRGYGRESGVTKSALKIDLHKAFDSVHWGFILATLRPMHFSNPFIGWIEACICSTMYLVRINRASNGFFPGAKGLRQGEPLSPYLFSIVINIFSCILNKFPSNYKFHRRCKELKLTHLFFYRCCAFIFSR